jgi:hypothetical protein
VHISAKFRWREEQVDGADVGRRFPSGWIGRQLVGLFLDAGLADVETFPKTMVSNDLDVADRVFSFFATADGLVNAGTVDPDDADRWRNGLRAADAAGRFFTSYTGFLVAGTRPKAAAGPA